MGDVQRELSLNNSTGEISSGIVVRFVRNARARRYVLRLQSAGNARLTIPRGGTLAEANAFLRRQSAWLQQQASLLRVRKSEPDVWTIGSTLLIRGERVRISLSTDQQWIVFGTERVKCRTPLTDLRPTIESHLRRLACQELPRRLRELAQIHDLRIHKVSIKSQRTRWGSCSARGTISLNWRLIHTPAFVRDYICLHELMHLREMNHSDRFWREVERVCPYCRIAEKWLKAYSRSPESL